MSTTTIRLSEELKARVAKLADEAGISAHNFIVQAVEHEAQRSELRREFVATARDRLQEMQRTGEGIAWDEARSYLLSRVASKRAARPRARKTAR